jgi:protease-4
LRRLIPRARRPFPGGRVAIVRLYGPITGGIRTADWIELLHRLRDSRRVPAVVLDIDSPGGSAAASDDLFLAVQRLASSKPVVAAIRGTGASGAYLAAMAANRVISNPLAAVGSIGVISVGPRLSQLFDRIGVAVSETKAGKLKGMGAPWREETEEERRKERELVDAYYEAFVDRVAKGRKLTVARARKLATGEVWLGEKAAELGLVDEVGDLEGAVEVAAKMAGVPAKSAPVRLRRPFFARLVDRFAVSATSAVAAELESRLWDRRWM